MTSADAMANALIALLRDGSVVAAMTPEDLQRARDALASHPFAVMLPDV
jgi:ABC-type amino acid transport system permease subunit